MKKIISFVLCVVLLTVCLTACGRKEAEPKEALNVGFLKGPTGLGAASLMSEAELAHTDIDYTFTLEADPSGINSALISGALDIAAVPTNVASVLYTKTEGKIQIIAVNTLGVLHILEKGNTVQSVADLAGKTVYATGQGANPQYVLEYILRENGLEPGRDVTVEYLPSDELTTRMVSGDIDICMLPVPAVTTVLMKNSAVRDALDLTAEWKAVAPEKSELTQGCLVARTDKVNKDTITRFLEEYKKSIDFMTNEENIDEASGLAARFEIVGSDAVAKAAIPQSGIVCVTGAEETAKMLDDYFKVLFDADPSSIGGKLPDEGLYFKE